MVIYANSFINISISCKTHSFKNLNQKIREPKLKNVAKLSNSNYKFYLKPAEYICNNFQLVKLATPEHAVYPITNYSFLLKNCANM